MRRTIIVVAGATAAVAILLPTTGFAGQIRHAKSAKPNNSALVHRVNTLAAALNALKGTVGTARQTIKTLASAVATTKSDVATLKTGLSTAQSNITGVQGDVTTLKGDVSTINSQLSAGATALTQINAALQDGTTGLVGLNKARPQFGAFQSDGTIIAGTGQVSGASGPKANALGHSGGAFVIDFGDDVSSRFDQVNPFPGSAAAGVPQATDCAATGAATTCGALQGVASDASPNHVLVVFGSGASAPASGFEVAALSG